MRGYGDSYEMELVVTETEPGMEFRSRLEDNIDRNPGLRDMADP